ncbi:uncharacterized protein PG986_014337 [Apiospora aurea]|uniref:ubiquitinyl hydrolase 1 n=1 Tax=Apiospora aurea TaxID=335848 RepID=A0ABR1PSN9_9PEZI
MSASQENEDFLYVIHHVFLPPRLPQQDDFRTSSDQALTGAVLDAMEHFKQYVSPEDSAVFQSALDMVCCLSSTRPGKRLDRCGVGKVIHDLADGGCLALELRAQNLGLFIHRCDNVIRFEPFELLAENKQVTACTGRLQRAFPACCMELDRSQCQVPQFQTALADMLSELDAKTHSSCRPQSTKRGDEKRDTIIPRMIGPVVGFLRGLGKQAEALQFVKNSREEVLWANAKVPWHRSATWLLLRVTLQLSFSRQRVRLPSCQLYKDFMIFLVITLIDKATKFHIADELLFCMITKFNRRMYKFSRIPKNTSYPPGWLGYASDVLTNATTRLEHKWEVVQDKDKPSLQLEALKNLDFKNDTFLKLTGLWHFVDITANPQVNLDIPQALNAGFDYARFRRDDVPTIDTGRGETLVFVLANIEQWICDELPQWLSPHVTESNTCHKLIKLLNGYLKKAETQYEGNPHNLSIMWLCVMELWVACDQAAIKQEPLLVDYSIGFPEGFLEILVLPRQSQMLRLRNVESYLREREARTKQGYPSAFEGFGLANSLAVRYYDNSCIHQQLHQEIVSLSQKKRSDKMQELEQKLAKYQALQVSYQNLEHDQEVESDYHGWEMQCRFSCEKCSLQSQMDTLSIMVHEWPLPDDELEARGVVFELRVPAVISDWRRVTMTLLIDLLRDSRQILGRSDRLYSPCDYADLTTVIGEEESGRLGLRSSSKPFVLSHYRDQLVSEASAATICKKHGCRYSYHDTNHDSPVSEIIGGSKIPSNCSFAVGSKLPLPDWIRGYSHTSNEVIARQSTCPPDLDLGEFRAIGHVRSGARLQWLNILVQLYAPPVDFNNIETALVILQAIGESGPCHDKPESHLRDSHAIVQDEDFARKLLGGLEATLLRFKENWECDIALFTLTSLCNRVMSLANSKIVWSACCDFTRQVRSVARNWAGKLLMKRADSDSEVERKDLHNRILAMALVSSSTFNADVRHTARVLNDNQSVTEFLEASILIHDHHPTNSCPLSPLALVSLQAWRKLCYRYEATIHDYIANDRSCLDRAVLAFWENYKPGNAWESLQPLRRHVMTSISSVSKAQRKLVVSMDILQGRLLVNGRPLSRLPAEYDRHPAYAQLFGSQILEIAPSDEPGLEYTAGRKQNGWLVHFGMTSGELIIRACKDGGTWEFVPPWHLQADLPEGLIVPYSHWRNTRTGELELRDIKKPWISRSGLWRTQVHPGGRTSLVNGDMSVIEPTSCTAEKIAQLFSPLEDAEYIISTLIRSIAILRIDLWRLNLSFTLPSQGYLVQSKKHPGMCIDSDQSFSALIGLRNKLVLRPQNDTLNKRRIVIIPHGTLDFGRDKSDHPATTIRFPTTSPLARYALPRPMVRRKYHCYEIDSVLGRLIDNGSLQSKLMICYLHAVTAHCLPDPLIGRTGTEEALRILKSAAILSFHRLQAEDIQLLSNIAKLSPVRSLYPSHLHEMQQITWSDKLGSLSQHDEFTMTVETILREGQYAELFFPETAQPIDLLKGSHPQLCQRALIRSACYRVDGFGAERFRRSDDLVYRRRDVAELLSSKQLEERVCQITRNLLFGQHALVSKIASARDLLNTLYAIFGNELTSHATSSLLPVGRFTIHWLDEPSSTIGEHWVAIQNYLTTVPIAESRYDLMAFFAALVYANEARFDVVQLLLAFVCASSVRGRQHPEYYQFELHHGRVYKTKVIRQMIESHKTGFYSTPESALPAYRREKFHDLKDRRQRAWQSKVDRLAHQFEEIISKQSLTGKPVGPDWGEYSCYFRVPSIMQCIQERFRSWKINGLLDSYLLEVIDVTAGLPLNSVSDPSLQMPATLPPLPKTNLERPFLTSDELFQQAAPSFSCKEAEQFQDLFRQKIGQGSDAHDDTMGVNKSVDALVAALRSRAMRRYETDYVHELETSFSSYLAACTAESNAKLVHDRPELEAKLREHVRACAAQVNEMQRSIYSHLRGTFIAEFPGSAHCLPRLSPIFIVQQLNRHNWSSIPEAWKTCIEQYALSISHYQRAGRLLSAIDNPIEFVKEVENVGHAWKLREYPESLLLEVESGLIIRDVQEEVASSMRGCSENRVMQLNMGEGKSSVIVQIVAAYLANGNRLVRVIVAKPQSKQMRHMLVTKIGGLLDRRVFFLPFSRSFVMDSEKLQQIQNHIEACKQSGGILLVQPEQLLSFKLMGLEYVGSPAFLPNSTNLGIGRGLIQSQKYLETHSRDIIDESDENFSVKFELIYTIGLQRPVEMSPDRWIVIQQVLEMIWRLAPDFAKGHPEGFELHSKGSCHFSRLRFLNDGPGSLLLKSVARYICDKGLYRFPIAHQNPETRQRVYEYITEPDLTGDQVGFVEEDKGGFFCDTTADILLLLRGLFSCGVLAFVFGQKRWRVNYGRAERAPPTQLAVPYRAKDSPAPRSEFSHPDVVIILTQLSYYYQGLSDEEMLTAFQQLERLDQKSTVYGEWVDRTPKLPSSYRQFSAVNLKDWSQSTRQLFPALRYTKSVIDFYLGKVVFPHEMVEFPQKLSASGWDLAKPRAQAVTGFSGTCDSKYVLPTDIPHIDLPSQLHTNAKVLDYILRSENLVVELGPSIDGDLLLRSMVSAQPPIDVVLDVGALIIDMDNRQFALRWLELSTGSLEKKQAVIFVNEDDEIMVIDRTGFAEPFLTSSFVDNTESCLVYLDEAHTRGIDLKLPDHYRACTTLGPKLTKDRLVQEIQEQIRLSRTAGGDGRPITVLDVLLWSISETWSDTYKSIPLWATQGLRHQRQEAIWAEMTKTGGRDLCSGDVADYFEDEAISLKERYGPRSCTPSQALLASHSTHPTLAGRQKQIDLIRTKCEQFGIETFGSAILQEEQERELAPEIEQERQVQHPQPLNPAKHQLHLDLRRLVSTGSPNLSGGAFASAFTAFKNCSAASLVNLGEFHGNLLVTSDFARTLSPAETSKGVYLIVLSPFEANLLLPIIKDSPHVRLHVYAPRTNLSFPCLQDLKLYTTPALPTSWSVPYTVIQQLNLFSGQLYFQDLREYQELCAYLGLSCTGNDGTTAVAVDGFVGKCARYPLCQFTRSPNAFLQFIMANVRRDRQDISRTHIGRMLTGEILVEDDFSSSV